ncbi:hypothetical protein LTR10_005479 [Elasticomyces elasticus]|nr:hypothetical protein LTR10_005479 [Elasticomyces elasticus]KAK4976217.1 hypothetical protein LTR42_003844 [Elasticomyces elasticus]
MVEGTTVLSSISTGVALTLRITEKIYEIIAVEQEAKDLLKTTAQISNQLAHAKRLRRQKSSNLGTDEKAMLDSIFRSTEEAVGTVAKLVEPARADMKVFGDRVRFGTRVQFVFRDMAHIPVSLAKLGIAGSGLNMALTLLCAKAAANDQGSLRSSSEQRAPPSYQESEWLHASRERKLRRKESAATLREVPIIADPSLGWFPGTLTNMPDDDASTSCSATMIPESELLGCANDETDSMRSYWTAPSDLDHRQTPSPMRHHSWLGHRVSTSCSAINEPGLQNIPETTSDCELESSAKTFGTQNRSDGAHRRARHRSWLEARA